MGEKRASRKKAKAARSAREMAKDSTRSGKSAVPSRETVLKYIADHPHRSGKREIAKAFGVKGADRVELKTLLAELESEGLLQRQGKHLVEPGSLPPVTVLEIVTRDRDGGLIAVATSPEYQGSDGQSPKVLVRPSRAARGKPAPIAGIGDRILGRITRDKSGGVEYSAKIIKVLDKRQDTVLGIVRVSDHGIRLEAVSRKQPETDIMADQLNGAKDGDLVEVAITGSTRYGPKRGKVVQVIGAMDSEKAVSMIAIHANSIPHVFPDNVMGEAEATELVTLDKPDPGREDWRDLPLITIDPADAKDHDDAVYAEADPEHTGGFIAYVAIADVAAYVTTGSAMDQEALKRGNSVYFPDRVLPMLPERISNNMCSLRENEDRAALAVRMKFDSNGKKRSHTFHRVLMRSHAKLAYGEAQSAIDGTPNERAKPLLNNVLEPLWAAYACMKRGREDRQPLELDLPERKILLKEDGSVDRVIVPERLDAHKLIEEFMIQANVAAAETLEQKKQPLIYRVHDAPSLDKLEKLREFLKSLNMKLAQAGSLKPHHFNGILGQVRGSENEELVSQVVLRSQSQAEYSPDNIGHFGLNLTKYAHFTSPIRRYADLIVHRALVGALGLGKGAIQPDEEKRLDVIAADISLTERRAMQAERETIDRLIAGFLATKIGNEFHGRINGVTKAGLFVTLSDTGADGFIPISMLGDDYYHFDEANWLLVGDRTGLVYQMGQEVDVKLVEAAPVAGALRFEMLSEGIKSDALPRSRNTNKRGKPGIRAKRGGYRAAGNRRKRH